LRTGASTLGSVARTETGALPAIGLCVTDSDTHNSQLVIFGYSSGLAWVLRNCRIPIEKKRVSSGMQLSRGDRIFFYTSRGCFGNTGADRGRIIGEAEVLTSLVHRPSPVMIGGREFTHECEIRLKSLAPFRQGVEIAELVPLLRMFPNKSSWSAQLRKPILAMPDEDAALVQARLSQIALPGGEAVETYWAGMMPTRRTPPSARYA